MLTGAYMNFIYGHLTNKHLPRIMALIRVDLMQDHDHDQVDKDCKRIENVVKDYINELNGVKTK